MGEVGAGQATKAVNQIMCAGINQAVTEALAFAQAQGLPMAKVIDVTSAGAAGNWFLDKRGLTMTNGTFAPGFKLALHHKDLLICQAMAAKFGLELPVSAMTIADYAKLMRKVMAMRIFRHCLGLKSAVLVQPNIFLRKNGYAQTMVGHYKITLPNSLLQ